MIANDTLTVCNAPGLFNLTKASVNWIWAGKTGFDPSVFKGES